MNNILKKASLVLLSVCSLLTIPGCTEEIKPASLNVFCGFTNVSDGTKVDELIAGNKYFATYTFVLMDEENLDYSFKTRISFNNNAIVTYIEGTNPNFTLNTNNIEIKYENVGDTITAKYKIDAKSSGTINLSVYDTNNVELKNTVPQIKIGEQNEIK